MPWTTTTDPGQFAAAAGGFLRSRLAEHNLLLTITDQLRRGQLRPGELPGAGHAPLLGWWAGRAGPEGAFTRTAGASSRANACVAAISAALLAA